MMSMDEGDFIQKGTLNTQVLSTPLYGVCT